MGRTVDVWEEARRNNQQSRVCGAGAGKVLRQLGERRMVRVSAAGGTGKGLGDPSVGEGTR